ncbi:Acg family FMN-binding oxidoreductase [Amycolatopsis sp. NPDC049252]|uniref:Acg family FMN-binding oxidoreductase n=1 Tax=Amycolatopsis sp. NPDC049252 TaxID=3363933 RepID=UPI003723A4CD
MDQYLPDAYTVRAAIALAVRAPSVHNTQPWDWRFSGRTVELRADPGRHLRHADPDGRDLLVSCGCVLHHFTVAAAALGWAAQIERTPEPGLLARITLVPHDTRDGDIALAAAIPRRRSDRRRFAERPLLVRDEVFLAKSASDHGALLRFLDDAPQLSALTGASVAAQELHRADTDYGIELAAWSGRRYAPDGVPAQNAVHTTEAPRVRDFTDAQLADTTDPDGAALTVLATRGDEPADRLRAGEAASAVVLTATRLNLASCLVTEPLELTSTRALVRDCVLGGALAPQLVVRVGYLPEGAAPLPATPRRPIGEVVRPLGHGYGAGLPIPAQLRRH